MDARLYQTLLSLPKENIIHAMWEALDHMQAYSGRTRQACVCMAIGCEEKLDDDGSIKYSMKSIKHIKEHTETMGL